MTYGHAERNLALIRQLEAEMLQLGVSSAAGHVPPSDQRLPRNEKNTPAPAETVSDRDPRYHRAGDQAAGLELVQPPGQQPI